MYQLLKDAGLKGGLTIGELFEISEEFPTFEVD